MHDLVLISTGWICQYYKAAFQKARAVSPQRNSEYIGTVMDSSVLLVYENDGLQIVEIVSKNLEEYGTNVCTSTIQQILDPPAYSAVVFILTPGMLSVLKSSHCPDLLKIQHNNRKCALFVHEYININSDSAQKILRDKLPSFPDWIVYHIPKKVRPLILQMLALIETEQEEPDPQLCLVSNIKLYPDTVWEQNQDVFISFNSTRTVEDKVIIEINSNLIKTTWINPFTSMFTVADYCGCGKRMVTVHVNEVPVGTSQVVIKDRGQILLDDINDVGSPLHYLKEILNMTQGREEKLQSEMMDSLILEGTRKLLKRLHGKFYESDKKEKPLTESDKNSEEHVITSSETEDDVVRLRPTRHAIRKRRNLSKDTQDDRGLYIEQLTRQSQRISFAQEFPSIKHNEELLKSLQADLFDFQQE